VKIWRCPDCGAGARAPERLEKLDLRRWCLTCSRKKGWLIERLIPSKAAEKARRAEVRKTTAEKRRERRSVAEAAAVDYERTLASSFDRHYERAADWLRAWAPRIVALKTLREHHKENHPGCDWKPDITIRQGGTVRIDDVPRDQLHDMLNKHRGSWAYSENGGEINRVMKGRQRASGHAWPWHCRLVVTTGFSAADDLSTLIHELAHLAAPNREMHGPVFQVIQRDAVRELTGEDIEGWHRSGEDGRVAVIQRWLDKQKETV
jgi:hypothetical protein